MVEAKPSRESDGREPERFVSRQDFDDALARHGASVLRYAWRLSNSKDDAEELVQETFMTLWKRRRSVSIEGDSLLPWLLVTCRNHGANLARRARRHEAAALGADLPISTASAKAQAELEWVLAEIATMTPLDREICRLCFLEGVPYHEAAEQLMVSSVVVAKRVQRVRQRLRAIRSQSE